MHLESIKHEHKILIRPAALRYSSNQKLTYKPNPRGYPQIHNIQCSDNTVNVWERNTEMDHSTFKREYNFLFDSHIYSKYRSSLLLDYTQIEPQSNRCFDKGIIKPLALRPLRALFKLQRDFR